MKNDKYDILINKLQQMKPTPNSAEELTDIIMNKIEMNPGKKDRYILLNVNDKQWKFINGARIFLTSAAALLIIFFGIQNLNLSEKHEQSPTSVMLATQKVDIPFNKNVNSGKWLFIFKEGVIPDEFYKLNTASKGFKKEKISYSSVFWQVWNYKQKDLSYREKMEQIIKNRILNN